MNSLILERLSRLQKHKFPELELSDVDSFEMIAVDESSLPRLNELGIHIQGSTGHQNLIAISPQKTKLQLTVHFSGTENNHIIIDSADHLKGHLEFQAGNNLVSVGSGWYSFSARFESSDGALMIGSGSAIGGAEFVVDGAERVICVGRNCLLSYGITVFSGDSHAIFDLDSLIILNPSKDVLIGERCWIGFGATILKGAELGNGSVLAAKSVLTSVLPSRVLAGGIPARIIRENIGYSRERTPGADRMREIKDEYDKIAPKR